MARIELTEPACAGEAISLMVRLSADRGIGRVALDQKPVKP